jgi:hypothetical protein
MNRFWPAGLVLMGLLGAALSSSGQMAPKQNSSGESVAIVLNDSSESMTVEYHKDNAWLPLKLDPGKDGTATGDRIRVATLRQDKAVITVDMPVQAGKKYRLAWNTTAAMWDLSATQ